MLKKDFFSSFKCLSSKSFSVGVFRDVICNIKQENYEGAFMNTFNNIYMVFHGLCLNT